MIGESCGRCQRPYFVTCRQPGHGPWCPAPTCDASLTCPKCTQAGSILIDLLTLILILAIVPAAFWLQAFVR